MVVGDGAIKNQPRLFVTWVGEGEEGGGGVFCSLLWRRGRGVEGQSGLVKPPFLPPPFLLFFNTFL